LGKNETGAVAASPIWLNFMQGVLDGTPMEKFSIPEGIVFMRIDAATGKPVTPMTKKITFECFKDPLFRDTL
jgi:penicillin-binding protein 1A